jgi:Tol biopolymer transport system component
MQTQESRIVAGDDPVSIVVSQQILTERGGRLDWCHRTNLIAFDRVTSANSSEVYTIRPDGSGERCITCKTPGLPQGIRGQPAWHPSGKFLIIQVQGKFYQHSHFEFVSWGIHNDLWLVAADGSWAQKLVEAEYLGANLHPHFSDSGHHLFWSVRQSTGRKIRQRLFHPTPGKENPWDGWQLALASFNYRAGGTATLSSRKDLYRGSGGFFESHAMRDDTIWFSHTQSGRPYVNDIFRARPDGTKRINITNSPGIWNEHGEPSPGGLLVTFNSSRSFNWKHPPDKAKTLRLELWARRATDGDYIQLTNFNKDLNARTRILTSDYAWGPSKREIAVYSATFGQGPPKQAIHILHLDQEY